MSTWLQKLPLRTLLGPGLLLCLVLVSFWLGTRVAPLPEPGTTSPGPEHHAHGQEWICAMHPEVRMPEPGKCPVCGMDLVVAGGEQGSDTQIRLGKRARVLARVRTEEVGAATGGGGELRLLGRVDYDETSLRTVTAWSAGRLDQLKVRVTGQRVKKGQVVARLYSPELYRAQQDLIGATRQLQALGQGTPMARSGALAALEAVRQRLRLLGVPGERIAAMEKQQGPSQQVSIRSPFSGVVIERMATEGSYVQTGTPLYRIADLSRLWVQLDAYEADLSSLQVGAAVSFSVDALPGQSFEGKVAFVDPVVDAARRTTRARVAVRNPEGKLRPGMFARARVKALGRPEQLTVGENAPLFTGKRSLLYVEVPGAEEPTYEARVVELGPKQGDRYPVTSGLSAGERVVVHGAFVLDADLQLRGKRSMLSLDDESEQVHE